MKPLFYDGKETTEDILIVFIDLLENRLCFLVDLPREGNFLFLPLFFRFREFRGENRHEGQRTEKRGHQREGNGVGHLHEEQSRHALDEGQREKDDDAGDGGGNDGRLTSFAPTYEAPSGDSLARYVD